MITVARINNRGKNVSRFYVMTISKVFEAKKFLVVVGDTLNYVLQRTGVRFQTAGV